MADRAFITPNILKWARESARITIETAAGKAGCTTDKIIEWEEGKSQPTINQAQALAKAYKRPFALFFLQEVPRDFHPLQDFRKPGSKSLTTSSLFIIREIQQKQAWINDLYEENNEEKLPFVGRYSTKNNPAIVAQDILDTLEITPPLYKTDNPIKEWIATAEAKGIFVSRTSFIHTKMKLDSEELQGFAIASPFAPFVFINSDDWNTAQLFTLVHELAHIWIDATGISNNVSFDSPRNNKLHPVELFCNEVAASALMPSAFMDNLNKSLFNNPKDIFSTAKRLGVSSFAFLVRSLKLRLIDDETYRKLKKQAETEYILYLRRDDERKLAQKKKEGGPNPYLLKLNKNGRLFTQIVLDSLRSGFVQPTQASVLLGTPVSNFQKLEAFIYK